jgi:hypothetical protein
MAEIAPNGVGERRLVVEQQPIETPAGGDRAPPGPDSDRCARRACKREKRLASESG